MAAHRVYLVPGFFGFANLGDLTYFGHVRDYLVTALPRHGIDAELHVVKPPPTASLVVRARTLLETVAATAGEQGPIHLIGHSSGGLDARLFVAPGANLDGADAEPFARRVRTCITVATPHRGTPVAAFFTSLLGQRLLQALSLATIYFLRVGRFPLSAVVGLTQLFKGGDERGDGALEALLADLLSDFSADRRSAIAEFLEHVRRDQSLMLQLAPEGMALFNASTRNRDGVSYASVVTRARAPGLSTRLSAGLSPAAHATHTIYDALYRIAASGEVKHELLDDQLHALVEGYGQLPEHSDNDGVVPTLSQPFGRILACAAADHLDVIGHFDDPKAEPPHFDWLTTGTDFNRAGFELVWSRVVRFIAQA